MFSIRFSSCCSGSNPVLIASPPELAGMTLESRLVSYDWKNQFDSFQQVTRSGSFKAICWDAKNAMIPVSFIHLLRQNVTPAKRSLQLNENLILKNLYMMLPSVLQLNVNEI